MNERFILHIKPFDSKWVCFRPLADWASPVTNQMLSRVVREEVGAGAKHFRADGGGGRKLMPGKGYDRSDWKKQEESHTKTFAQSDALSRGSFLTLMLP